MTRLDAERERDPDDQKVIEVELTDLAYGGDAVGRDEGRAIFLAGGLPGERVRARVTQDRKTYLRGELIEIMKASPDRVEPPYPELGLSGGFQWQHFAYPAQALWKERIVRQALRRIGRFDAPEVRPTIGAPEGDDRWRYRTVAQFAVGAQGAIGFRRMGSHDALDMPECPIARPTLDTLYQQTRAWIKRAWGEHAGDFVRRFTLRLGLDGDPARGALAASAGLLTLEASHPGALLPVEAESVCHALQEAIPSLAGVTFTGLTSTSVTVGRPFVYERVLNYTYRISMGSFFQVNATQTPRLVEQALLAADPRSGDRILDGYSGAGLFSLFLAERAAQVWAIESQPGAVADAQANLTLNDVDNVTLAEGALEGVLRGARMVERKIDVALVDPPRAGCHPQALREIVRCSPRRLVYVSCDPTTLARDLRLICDAGYHLAWAQPVDMFPQTTHIECVALCERD